MSDTDNSSIKTTDTTNTIENDINNKRKIEEDKEKVDESNKKIKTSSNILTIEEMEEIERIGQNDEKKPKLLPIIKPSQKVLSDPILGLSGLLFSFNNGREKQASKDLYNLLNEYIDEKEKNTTTNSNDEFDFNAAFQKELQQVKESTGPHSKLTKYKNFSLKCNGISFMGFNPETCTVDPIELTTRIFQDCERLKSVKSKEIQRLIPITKLVHVSSLMKELEPLLKLHFKNDSPKTYKIEFKSRMNQQINKVEYIVEIAKLVDKQYHKVDLVNPNLTIIIEIIHFYCAISIVDNYQTCKRFNLSNVAGIPQSTVSKKKKI